MEDNLNGIRRLSLNVDSEEGFKAKPVHIYDVCLDEKEYKKMLSDEKKIPLNWFKQVWQYALYLFQLAIVNKYCYHRYLVILFYHYYNRSCKSNQ